MLLPLVIEIMDRRVYFAYRAGANDSKTPQRKAWGVLGYAETALKV
tara:strand:- start:3460 stop:3597 length:138 start_codon:yes stop_codon:yes gene_type:complete